MIVNYDNYISDIVSPRSVTLPEGYILSRMNFGVNHNIPGELSVYGKSFFNNDVADDRYKVLRPLKLIRLDPTDSFNKKWFPKNNSLVFDHSGTCALIKKNPRGLNFVKLGKAISKKLKELGFDGTYEPAKEPYDTVEVKLFNEDDVMKLGFYTKQSLNNSQRLCYGEENNMLKGKRKPLKRTLKNARKPIRSEFEDEAVGFEVDQEVVDTINDTDGFGDDLSKEEVEDALVAIAEIAKAVVVDEEMAPEEVVDKVSEIVNVDDFGEEEEFEIEEEEELPEELENALVRVRLAKGDEIEEEEELPEELENALVRVMVAEGDEIKLGGEVEPLEEQIYEDEIEGVPAVVYDTTEIGADDFEILDDLDEEDEGLVVMGNSLIKNPTYKKGHIKLSSSTNKKVWSSSYKKVKKLLNGRKFKATDWAIVQCLTNSTIKNAAAKEARELDNLKRVVQTMKNNTELTKSIFSGFAEKIVSETEDDKKKMWNSDDVYDSLDELRDKVKNGASQEDILKAIDKAYEEVDKVHDKAVKSSVITNGYDELDGQPTSDMTPDMTEGDPAIGKLDENPDVAEGEVDSPFGDTPKKPEGDGGLAESPEDLIVDGAKDAVEVDLPVENSFKTLVLKKLDNAVYKVVGAKPCNGTKIKVHGLTSSKNMTRKCPLKSGTIIALDNGMSLMLKNSNIAGMLVFYGKCVKSSKTAPYYATLQNGKVMISQSKQGTDLFAVGEKAFFNEYNNLRQHIAMIKNNRAMQEKDNKIKELTSSVQKLRGQLNRSRVNSAKAADIVAQRECERLFQANKKSIDSAARQEQINNSRNVDTMSSFMDKMFRI